MYFKYAHLRTWGEMTRISGIWLKILKKKKRDKAKYGKKIISR